MIIFLADTQYWETHTQSHLSVTNPSSVCLYQYTYNFFIEFFFLLCYNNSIQWLVIISIYKYKIEKKNILLNATGNKEFQLSFLNWIYIFVLNFNYSCYYYQLLLLHFNFGVLCIIVTFNLWKQTKKFTN